MKRDVLSLAAESLVPAGLSTILLLTVPIESSLEPPSLLRTYPPVRPVN